jgi:hypothetical protein
MPAQAEIEVHFHSFNGSMFGRYPHAFVIFEGRLDDSRALGPRLRGDARRLGVAGCRSPC